MATTSIAVAIALAGCASDDTGADRTAPTVDATAPSEQSQIYSAALQQLLRVDNPHAGAPAPPPSVHIVDSPASRSSELFIAADGPQLDSEVKKEIAAQSEPITTVEFITAPEQQRIIERGGAVEGDPGGVIVGLAAPAYQDDGTVQVGAGLWCGFDCGIGLTYVLDDVDGQWTVTGTTGPVPSHDSCRPAAAGCCCDRHSGDGAATARSVGSRPSGGLLLLVGAGDHGTRDGVREQVEA